VVELIAARWKPSSAAVVGVTKKPITVTFFVRGFSLIDVASTVLEHAVEYPGQFVGGRRERLGGTETSFEATEVRTKGLAHFTPNRTDTKLLPVVELQSGVILLVGDPEPSSVFTVELAEKP
jgi:hypothetical protein